MRSERNSTGTDRLDLAVKISPNAQKDQIAGAKSGELIVKINAAPENGKANRALIAFLACEFGATKSEIVIKRGENSRHKVLSVPNTSEIRAKLANYEEEKR
ncbi:UPF0235 protein [Campylobacterota bacterium]|nr:UPF0235 protein [Campylobacterota bacterium]